MAIMAEQLGHYQEQLLPVQHAETEIPPVLRQALDIAETHGTAKEALKALQQERILDQITDEAFTAHKQLMTMIGAGGWDDQPQEVRDQQQYFRDQGATLDKLMRLEGCLKRHAVFKKSTEEAISDFWRREEQEERPASTEYSEARRNGSVLSGGAAESHAMQATNSDAIEAGVNHQVNDGQSNAHLGEWRTATAPTFLLEHTISALSVIDEDKAATYLDADEAVKYLDAVTERAIYGGGTLIIGSEDASEAASSELALYEEGTERWHERIQREAEADKFAVEQHPEYREYKLREFEVQILEALADDIESSGDVEGEVKRFLSKANQYEEEYALHAPVNGIWLNTAGGDTAAPETTLDAQQAVNSPDTVRPLHDTQPIPIIVPAEKESGDASSEDVSPMRQLLTSRRLRWYSGEGLREATRIIADLGRLAVGSASTAEEISEAARRRLAKRLVDMKKIKIAVDTGQKPDYRIRGAHRIVWRHKYSKNSSKLDEMIERILAANIVNEELTV